MARLCYKCVKILPNILFRGASKSCILCMNNKINSDLYRLLSNANESNVLLKRSQYTVISGKRTKNLNYPDVEKIFNRITDHPSFIYREDSIVNTIDFWQKYLHNEARFRDRFVCHYCLNYGDTVDHIMPISEGGEDELYNMVTCCAECNHLKGTLSYEYFNNNRLELRKKKFSGESIDKRSRKRPKYDDIKVTETAISNISQRKLDWRLKKDSNNIRKQNKKRTKNRFKSKYDEC